MDSLKTKDIWVSVQANYQAAYSRPDKAQYIFSYEIEIRNQGEITVQLLRRHWFIFDSDGQTREVEGEGVIGRQPVLEPGQSHQYNSWCPLRTGIGKMHGYFLMQNLKTGDLFKVRIPEFKLMAAPLSN